MVPFMSHHMYKLKNTSLKIDFVMLKKKKKLTLLSRIVHTIFLQLHKMINRYLNNVILTRVHHGFYLVVYFIYSWSLAIILYFQRLKIFNCSIVREFFRFNLETMIKLLKWIKLQMTRTTLLINRWKFSFNVGNAQLEIFIDISFCFCFWFYKRRYTNM